MQFVCTLVHEFVIIEHYSKSSLVTDNNRLNNWLSNLAFLCYLLLSVNSSLLYPLTLFIEYSSRQLMYSPFSQICLFLQPPQYDKSFFYVVRAK